MRSYAEREVFTDAQIEVLRLATHAVGAVGDSWGSELRCHELARAVCHYLRDVGHDGSFVDGRLGAIEHSWIELAAPSAAILDVYTPGRVPQVQLIHRHRWVSLGYEVGSARDDVDDAVVQRLRDEMSAAEPAESGRVALHHVHASPQASRVEFEQPASVTWRGDGGSLPLKRRMARRLAVCWNVLEGVPTDALEAGALRDLLDAVAAGDLARAQSALARVDASIDLTEDGEPHACPACRPPESAPEG